MIETVAVLSALVGAIYSAGEHDLIPNWNGQQARYERASPAWPKFAGVVMFAIFATMFVQDGREVWVVGLVAIGAAKLAELATSTVIETVRGY